MVCVDRGGTRRSRPRRRCFPAATAVSFGPAEAARAAQLYVRLRRARGREVDLAIAACALTLDAQLWTLNRDDFRDLPGLELYQGS